MGRVPAVVGSPAVTAPQADVGTEYVVDAHGCDAAALRDRALLDELFRDVVDALGLLPAADTLWKIFPSPGGITGLLLLEESHLTVHTFPEHRTAAFNLYCCRPRSTWPWHDELSARLGASRVTVRAIERVGGAERPERNSGDTRHGPRRPAA